MTTRVDCYQSCSRRNTLSASFGIAFRRKWGKKYTSEDSPRSPKTQAKGRRKDAFPGADTALWQLGCTWPLHSCGLLGLSRWSPDLVSHEQPRAAAQGLLKHRALSTLTANLPSSELSGPPKETSGLGTCFLVHL